jgi:filamentous hemagglutinin family protein
VSHAALALPSGASVQSGSVSLTRSPNLLTVNQSSQDAIINWSSFSIGAAGTVQFNNGSGATLNRVTGSDVSTIDGMLNATGSVYLINPNGVIIGKSGQVNVGGTFVASTLDLVDDNLDGATQTFTGSSGASITNLGSISALGGDVVLIANNVHNYGSITAPNGDIGLLAGSQILISDVATDDGKFSVQIGGPGTSVVNEGALQAAMVELRANQGNVYALAGNTTSVINATGVSAESGQVFLVAENGYTVAQGTITAAGPVGTTGGQVTTSGITVGIDRANVTAGNWTIQQDNFVLTPEAATALSANLATTSITVQTVGSDNGKVGGDINLAASLSCRATTA